MTSLARSGIDSSSAGMRRASTTTSGWARARSSSASIEGSARRRPGDQQPTTAGVRRRGGHRLEGVEQVVETLVRPEIADEPEHDVVGAEAVVPPGVGVRHVVRVDAEIRRVGHVEHLVGRDLVQAAPAAATVPADSTWTTSARATTPRRSSRSTCRERRVVREHVVDGPDDAPARRPERIERAEERGRRAPGPPPPTRRRAAPAPASAGAGRRRRRRPRSAASAGSATGSSRSASRSIPTGTIPASSNRLVSRAWNGFSGSSGQVATTIGRSWPAARTRAMPSVASAR